MKSDVWTPIRHVRIADQWVAAVSRQQLVSAALSDAANADRYGRVRTRLVFDANGQGISMARTDAGYRRALDRADLIHADGQFIVNVSRRYCAQPIPERAPTTDMIHDFALACERSGRSFYLLGASEAVNAEAVRRLRLAYPRLAIVGRHHGFIDGHEDAVVADIAAARPDFLWVGMGKPIEQQFCARFRDRLNAVWTITCGGCFNFITGKYRRAPLWMQDASLEWLYRMMSNPRHLFWRYMKTTPHALSIALQDSDSRTKVMGFDAG